MGTGRFINGKELTEDEANNQDQIYKERKLTGGKSFSELTSSARSMYVGTPEWIRREQRKANQGRTNGLYYGDGKKAYLDRPEYYIGGEMGNGENGGLESSLSNLNERKRINALNAARDQTIGALNKEKRAAERTYNQARSVVGGQSAQSARNLSEYMSQRGLNQSGTAIQGEINRLGTLGTNLAGVENQNSDTLADIAQRTSNAQITYAQGVKDAKIDTQIAEQEAIVNAQAAQQEYEQELSMLGYKNDLAKELASYKAGLDLNNNLSAIRERAKYSGSGGSGGDGMTKDQAYYTEMQTIDGGSVSPATLKANAMSLIEQYGYSKYQAMLKAATEKYNASREQLGVGDYRILAGEQ